MSHPNLDARGRMRSVCVTFRVSPEEAEELDRLVALSGMTKQDYIIRRLSNRSVTVMPSSRLHKALRANVDAVYRELRRIHDASEMTPELAEITRLLVREYQDLSEDPRPSDSEVDARMIEGMGRG